MAQDLYGQFPDLVDSAEPLQIARQLVRSGSLLPILDGFDEMAVEYWPDALRALNDGLDAAEPFVLTTRADEYTRAVEANGPLSFAAAVQLEDLTLDDTENYLNAGIHDTDSIELWRIFFDRLRNEAEGSDAERLRMALATPLMVSMARRIYSSASESPLDLLDSATFPSVRSIQDHLLDRYVYAAFNRPLIDPDELPRSGPYECSSADARR